MSTKNRKELYTFEVENLIEKEVREEVKDKETGESQTILKKESVDDPFKFFFMKPSRQNLDDMQEEYSVELSKSVSKGIMTKAMLSKKYRDNGGAYTKEEQKSLDKLYDELKDLTKDSMEFETKKKLSKAETKKLADIDSKSRDVRGEIMEIESSYQALFENTAEVRAQNVATNFLLLTSSYYIDPATKRMERLFNGVDYEDLKESYYKIVDLDDDVFNNAIPRLMVAVAAWYFTGDDDITKTVDELNESGAGA